MSKWTFVLDYVRHRSRILGSIFSLLSAYALCMVYQVTEGKENILRYLSMALSETLHITITILYIYLLFCVRSRFELLNEALR